MAAARKLTDKQRLWAERYMVHWNASRAAREAGYSEKSARLIGHENITKPYIRTYIEERLGEAAMGANEVLKRLSDQARASLFPFVHIDEDGSCYFDFGNPEAQDYFHLIKKIRSKRKRFIVRGKEDEEWEHEWVEVELYDSQKALIELGRHHALFTDKTEQIGGSNVQVRIFLPDNGRDVSDSD